MKSLKWLLELGLLCTVIQTLCIYAAFDTWKLSADLKYIATEDFSTLHMLRPSELAGRVSQHSCLLEPGCRQLAQAVVRGWCCEKQLLSREQTQLAMHHPSADGTAGCCPRLCLCKPELLASRSCLKPPALLLLINLFYPCITWGGDNLELAWGLGISLEFMPRSKNGIEKKPASGAKAVCEVFSTWLCSCWP